MNKKKIKFLLYGLLIIIFLAAKPAFSHKVNIFAYVEDNHLKGDSYFYSGDKVFNGQIEVYDVQGKRIAVSKTDIHGKFSLPLPLMVSLPLRILLRAGQGHQSDYILTAAEFVTDTITSNNKLIVPAEINDAVRSTSEVKYISVVDLELIITRILEKKLVAFTTQIFKLVTERGVFFQDVIGGLGYIVGMLGIALYIKARKK